MSKIAMYNQSVAQATDQFLELMKVQQEIVQDLGKFHQMVKELPESLATQNMPVALAMEQIAENMRRDLGQVKSVLVEIDQAKKDTHQSIALIEYQATALETTAKSLLHEQRQTHRKDLKMMAGISAIAASLTSVLLSLAVIWSTSLFSPSQEAKIGKRVLQIMEQADPQTQNWLNSNIVQPAS